ncbi:MAG: hypothetical protein GX241_05685 [Ruminococcaceae bacterium]|nr:hypothetical protein [Oscillospiraceae bacterium]
MKRFLSLVLVFLMIFALSACNNDDPTLDGGPKTINGGQPSVSLSQFSGKLIEPTMKLIASGNYMYQTTIDGVSATYATTDNGQNMLFTMPTKEGTISYIKMGSAEYIAFPTQKLYGDLTDAIKQKYDLTNIGNLASSLDLRIFLNTTFAEEGTITYENVLYKYEDYFSPTTQVTSRFLFESETGTLRYFGAIDASGNLRALPAVLAVYEATSDVFNVVSTYKRVSEQELLSAKVDPSSVSTQ